MAALQVRTAPIRGKLFPRALVIHVESINTQKWALDVVGLVAGLTLFAVALFGVSKVTGNADDNTFSAGAAGYSPSTVEIQR